jgi:phosphatidate phosphatase PAH1
MSQFTMTITVLHDEDDLFDLNNNEFDDIAPAEVKVVKQEEEEVQVQQPQQETAVWPFADSISVVDSDDENFDSKLERWRIDMEVEKHIHELRKIAKQSARHILKQQGVVEDDMEHEMKKWMDDYDRRAAVYKTLHPDMGYKRKEQEKKVQKRRRSQRYGGQQ